LLGNSSDQLWSKIDRKSSWTRKWASIRYYGPNVSF